MEPGIWVGHCERDPDDILGGIRRAMYQEEAVYEDIKVQGRKLVTRVVVVPHTDLYGGQDCSVEEEEAAARELA